MSIPPIVLALAIAGVLGPGERNMIIALVLVLIPALIRLVRGQVLAIREETFIEASRSIGSTPTRIMAQRVLLNAASPLIVQIAYLLGSVLIVEAGLSFLGLGVQAPTPSWGNMLRRAYDTALFTDSWALMIPGAAIALTVLAFNEVSDAMRDSFTSAGATARRRRHDRRGRTSVDARSDGSRPIGDDVLLRIDDLRVDITMGGAATTVVDGVSLDIGRGEIVGLVGESGCGKTVTAMSILQLMPSPPVRIVGGSIWFEGRDLLRLPFRGLRAVRGAEIAFVFQDPMSSLDPAFTIGDQLIEAQRLHGMGTRRSRRTRAVELLQLVGIPAPEQRMDDYPHQLSGGMRQRVMIAIALANDPKLLVADEPTTALDVTVQAQILDLLRRLRGEYGLSLLLVTHDLGVVADVCDRVAVMYAGQIVEASPVDELFAGPKHPYTAGLLRAMPQTSAVGAELETIPGTVPQMDALPIGCRFAPRCPHRVAAVCDVPIDLERAGDGRSARCARSDELELTVAT